MQPIVVLGDINVDALMPIPTYPHPGQEAMSRELVLGLGGSAANTAVVLARLGWPVRLIGRVGADAWGDLALQTLAASGVDTTGVRRDPVHTTGLAFIPALPDGDHVMFCYRGANDYYAPEELPAEIMDGASLLHLSGYALGHAPQRFAAARAVELAAEKGVPLSLDTALEPALRFTGEMRVLLSRLDLCILGPQEAQALTGAETPSAAIAMLLAAGVQRVGYKLGGAGCIVASAAGSYRMSALAVATVDTTGAGDAFSAGLIAGYLAGRDLAASARLATALGGLATTVWGGGAALPERAELEQRLHALAPELEF